jgi:hypothetical protein
MRLALPPRHRLSAITTRGEAGTHSATPGPHAIGRWSRSSGLQRLQIARAGPLRRRCSTRHDHGGTSTNCRTAARSASASAYASTSTQQAKAAVGAMIAELRRGGRIDATVAFGPTGSPARASRPSPVGYADHRRAPAGDDAGAADTNRPGCPSGGHVRAEPRDIPTVNLGPDSPPSGQTNMSLEKYLAAARLRRRDRGFCNTAPQSVFEK